jgi:hypothetical protein
MRKSFKKFYSIASFLLCICILASALMLASCGILEPTETDSADKAVETLEQKKVVRIKKGILSGRMISGENLELVDVPVASIPEGAIDSVEAIVGKYAAIDMVLGEYVFERMLTNEAPVKEEEPPLLYVIVNDMISNANGRDITEDLQSLIDTHPGRTIYFNDGNYTISSTIHIPADKEKAVSFRLSNYATIKAAEGWKSDSAMIAIGANTDSANAEVAANTIMGGCIDGAGFAQIGLSIENSSNVFVSDITLKGFKTSMQVKASADSVNAEGITVMGGGQDDSIAIVNESSKSVFSTINIANVSVGIKNSGVANDFRNVFAKCNKPSTASAGFIDNGSASIFELCTAEDFANGYVIGDGVKSVYESCNAAWTKADITVQSAFVAEGTFNSVLTGCMARFFDASSDNAYIKVTTRGSGVVKAPIFDVMLCDDRSYGNVLAGTVIPIK